MYYTTQSKDLNEDQIRADKEGKAAVWKYLTEHYQHTISLYDTDHKSKQCRADFIAEYSNGFINIIDVKNRFDTTSFSYQTTYISAAKIQSLYDAINTGNIKGYANAYVFVYFADGALYQFDVAKIYKDFSPTYKYVRRSRLGLGDGVMKNELIYEIPLDLGLYCGQYDISDKDIMEYFDWNLKKSK